MQKTLPRTTRIITGVISGGIIGYLLSLLDEAIILTLPGVGQLFTVVPFPVAVSLPVVGMVIGGGIGALIAQRAPQFSRGEQGGDIEMTLREEQLDIEKDRIKTGDVDIHKEVVTDEKNITVPVSREELIVEKTKFGHGEETETNRIPLSEERIDVDKETVQLNDVSVHKEKSQNTETIEETMKKEKLAMDKEGDAEVTEKNNDN